MKRGLTQRLLAHQTSLEPASSSPTVSTLFERLPASRTGIDFVHQWAPRDQYEKLLLKTGFAGGGICVGDDDNDGLCDIYFTRPHGDGRNRIVEAKPGDKGLLPVLGRSCSSNAKLNRS